MHQSWSSVEALWRLTNLGIPGGDWTALPNRTLEALQHTAHLLR